MTNPLTIVAEAAQGFEGDPTQARLLVRAAAAGEADLIKFQLVYADELAVPAYRWHDLFRTLEMTPEAWCAVREEAARAGVGLAFDVFGERSLEEALSLGARVIKIHSTDFFNEDLVAAALKHAHEVQLSLGGIAIDELDELLNRHSASSHKIVIMCGYQAEPTRTEDNHLARVGAMRARYPEQRLGWMDHADGGSDEALWLGVLALPYGVTVVEKHITLARRLNLEDSVSALDPAEFRTYSSRLRRAVLAIGSDTLVLTGEERAYRERAVKVVIASRDVAAGEQLEANGLLLKRAPLEEGRIVVRRLEHAIGRRTRRAIAETCPIYLEDLE